MGHDGGCWSSSKGEESGGVIGWRLQSWVAGEAEIGHAAGFSENIGSGRKKEKEVVVWVHAGRCVRRLRRRWLDGGTTTEHLSGQPSLRLSGSWALAARGDERR